MLCAIELTLFLHSLVYLAGFHLSSKDVSENLDELETLKEEDERGRPGLKLKDVLMVQYSTTNLFSNI